MRVSEKFKLIACKLEKVGSTNIARVLYALDHLSTYNNSNKILQPQGRKQGFLEKTNEIRTYTKFMFVRDPLERLLSAYRDRKPKAFFAISQRISFRKYLEALLSRPEKKLNKHVTSFNSRCQPCVIKYDFIGLLENFEPDMKTILRSVGADNAIILPKRSQTGYQKENSAEVLKQYLADVPKITIQKIYERYYLDYYLFGFKKPEL